MDSTQTIDRPVTEVAARGRQTLIDTAYATLWYHPQGGIVHHRLHQYVPDLRFRDLLLAGVEALRKEGGSKWLSDDRKAAVVTPSLQQWAIQNWFPQARAAGWKYWAILLPENALGHEDVGTIARNYAGLGITVQFFEDPDAALRWLQSLR